MMLFHKYRDERRQREQTPSTGYGQGRQAVACPSSRLDRLLRLLGIIAPFVTGAGLLFTTINSYVLTCILIGLVSAILLRSRWTLLVVPLAFITGWAISFVIFASIGVGAKLAISFPSLFAEVVIVLFGAVLGYLIDRWLERRQSR